MKQIICNYFSLLILSCFHVVAQSNSAAPKKIEIDTIRIKVDHTFCGEYSGISSKFFESRGDLFFCGYNSKANQLDIINITKKAQNLPIKISREGPNKVSVFLEFCVYNDQFYFYSPIIGEVTCVDQKGIVQKRYNLVIPDKIKNIYSLERILKNGRNFTRYDYHPSFQIINNTMFLALYSIKDRFSKDYYDQFSYLCLDMKKGSSQILSFNYPELLRGKDFYGDLTHSSLVNFDGEIILNYGFSSALYDTIGRKFDRWAKNKGNIEIIAKPITSQDDMDLYKYTQYYDSYHFGSLVVDSEKNLCIKPLYISKFEGNRKLLPKETNTEISVYKLKDWSLVTKIIIERKISPYIFKNKIYYWGDLVQIGVDDFFEVYMVTFN